MPLQNKLGVCHRQNLYNSDDIEMSAACNLGRSYSNYIAFLNWQFPCHQSPQSSNLRCLGLRQRDLHPQRWVLVTQPHGILLWIALWGTELTPWDDDFLQGKCTSHDCLMKETQSMACLLQLEMTVGSCTRAPVTSISSASACLDSCFLSVFQGSYWASCLLVFHILTQWRDWGCIYEEHGAHQ